LLGLRNPATRGQPRWPPRCGPRARPARHLTRDLRAAFGRPRRRSSSARRPNHFHNEQHAHRNEHDDENARRDDGDDRGRAEPPAPGRLRLGDTRGLWCGRRSRPRRDTPAALEARSLSWVRIWRLCGHGRHQSFHRGGRDAEGRMTARMRALPPCGVAVPAHAPPKRSGQKHHARQAQPSEFCVLYAACRNAEGAVAQKADIAAFSTRIGADSPAKGHAERRYPH